MDSCCPLIGQIWLIGELVSGAFVSQQPPNTMVLMMFLCQASIMSFVMNRCRGHSSELTNYLDVKAASFQSMPRLLFVQSSQTRKQLSVMSYKRQLGHVSKDWMIG